MGIFSTIPGVRGYRPNYPQGFFLDMVLVAGGGGAGTGGGGAGGFLTTISGELAGGNNLVPFDVYRSMQVAVNTYYDVIVGAGGVGEFRSANGALAQIPQSGTFTAFGAGQVAPARYAVSGGGRGGGSYVSNGLPGGSGGGGAGYVGSSTAAGTAQGVPAFGFSGGRGSNETTYYTSGGGGGAGGVGGAGANPNAGNGGPALSSLITGVSRSFAGGGGGGATLSGSIGGTGGFGGGNGVGGQSAVVSINGGNGTANTGGGGGGYNSPWGANNDTSRGGNGGSGIVILRYPNNISATFSAGITFVTSPYSTYKVSEVTAGLGTVIFS